MASNMIWRGSQVRSRFIEFFKLKKHLIVPSSSVIPPRTLGSYFVNAGMNQVIIILCTVHQHSPNIHLIFFSYLPKVFSDIFIICYYIYSYVSLFQLLLAKKML